MICHPKAGSVYKLMRWTSLRTLSETFAPPTDYRYPFLGLGSISRRLVSGSVLTYFKPVCITARMMKLTWPICRVLALFVSFYAPSAFALNQWCPTNLVLAARSAWQWLSGAGNAFDKTDTSHWEIEIKYAYQLSYASERSSTGVPFKEGKKTEYRISWRVYDNTLPEQTLASGTYKASTHYGPFKFYSRDFNTESLDSVLSYIQSDMTQKGVPRLNAESMVNFIWNHHRENHGSRQGELTDIYQWRDFACLWGISEPLSGYERWLGLLRLGKERLANLPIGEVALLP